MGNRYFVLRFLVIFSVFVFFFSHSIPCNSSPIDNKGKIVIEKFGYRYVEWPFTFSGLTIGRPVNNLDLLGTLYIDNKNDVISIAKKYLTEFDLKPSNIPLHQNLIWGHDITELNLNQFSIDTRKELLKEFSEFLQIELPYQHIDVELVRRSATPLILNIRSAQSGTAIHKSLNIEKLIQIIGKPDLSYDLPNTDRHLYFWQNLMAVQASNKLIAITLNSCIPTVVGPAPKSAKDFSVGWLMPWEMVMQMAQRPEMYELFLKELSKKGLKWQQKNQLQISQFALAFFGHDVRKLKLTEPVGFMGGSNTNLKEELRPLFDHLFPGIRLSEEAFNEFFFGQIVSNEPGIIDKIGLSFGFSGAMNLSDFKKVYGEPDEVIKEKIKNGERLNVYYLQKKISALFVNNRLVGIEFNSEPIIFPPPDI